MRVLIADDDPIAVKAHACLLESHPDVDLTGYCLTLAELRNQVGKDKPDAVLLDIDFPDGSGLEVVQDLNRMGIKVILLTAHDEHALEAFKQHVLDYLVKPITVDRLNDALRYLRETLTPQNSPQAARITVQSEGIMRCLLIEQIQSIAFNDRHTEIRLSDEQTLSTHEPLSSLIERLKPHGFVQISRSEIVPVSRIAQAHANGDGRTRIVMDNGETHLCSKRRSSELRQILRQG